MASGSKGNATLIMSEKTALLVDAGVSCARLERELKELGLGVDALDGVLITHEHDDHIRALPKLSGRCKIYAHPLTARELDLRFGALKYVVGDKDFELGFEIGDICVQPFRIPHDAAYPLAYSFVSGGARCSVATDIGVPTYGLLRNIKDSQAVLLEANHDLKMLKEGSYPPRLKQRIMSPKGHLSNDSSAKIAKLIAGEGVKNLILGHISQNNNSEQLAYDTVRRALDEEHSDISLSVAHQDRRSEQIAID